MGETGLLASGPQHSPGVQHGDIYNSLAAVSRALAAAAASPAPAEEDTRPVPLSLSRSASDAVDSAVAVLAEASRGSMSLEKSCERGACCSSLTDRAASAEMKAIASGNAADMVAMLTAHRQIATGDTEPACEIRQNLRVCSGVLGSAAKFACEASAKAGPIGGLAWQIAVLDAMPLGPSALDYNFTARGHLPEGLQQSKLAAAFGPEQTEDAGEDMGEGTPGKAARVEIGNALVALLESHRKHRYTVASADPESIIKTLTTLPDQGDDRIEVEKRARSLTRSLTRSAASSPLVQLLATHRKRREDLTGWQDETSCSSDDEFPHVKLSSTMANQGSQAGGLIHAENALTLKPLLTSVEQRGSDQLPPLPPNLARETGTSNYLPVLPSRQCPPCPGSPTQPPLPSSSRSSVDGRSSVSSYMSAQATSIFSETQSSDWVTALSSLTAASRSSLDGSSSRRGSTDGRSSFEGRPPLHGMPFKRVEVGYNSSTSAASELVQTGLLDGQCPGCGSMNECCCKDMELGSHPDLESIPDDLASISDLMGSALKGLSAPLPPPSEGGPFTESHKALRRLLLKQMPAEGEKFEEVAIGASQQLATRGASFSKEESEEVAVGTSQKLAMRGASFSEVLENCMRSNSSSASQSAQMAPTTELSQPFIPMSLQMSSDSSNDDEERLERQHLGTMRAWSFDDTLQRVHLMKARPGVLNRHSLDGDQDKKSRDKSSYATLMAEYRNRMGMDRSSRSSSLSRMAENPSASVDVSGALKQAFRSQLQSPARSLHSFESPLLNGQYNALRTVSEHGGSDAPAAIPLERKMGEMKRQADRPKQRTVQQHAVPARVSESGTPPALTNWPSDEIEAAASGSLRAQNSKQQGPPDSASDSGSPALAPHDAAKAARVSLLSMLAVTQVAVPFGSVLDMSSSGKSLASPGQQRSAESSSMSRTDSAVNSRAALSPAPSGATAAAVLGIARGPGRQDQPAPIARQSCARVRASLELRRQMAENGALTPVSGLSAEDCALAQPATGQFLGKTDLHWPAPEQPVISFPLLPAAPVPAQLPMNFIKSPGYSQRNSSEGRTANCDTTTSGVLAAVAAQLGHEAPSPRASQDLAAGGPPAAGTRRSAHLSRPLPTVEEGVATTEGARELSLNLGVPDLQQQVFSDNSPPDASHEPPEVELAAASAESPASSYVAAGRLAAANQLFFQGAQPARKRMGQPAGMLAAENASGPQQLPVACPGLRSLRLSLPRASTTDRDAMLQRAPRPSSPGTPPAVCEATPFSEMLHPVHVSAPPAASFIMQGLSEGVLHSAPARHGYGQHGLPMASSPCASSSPIHGFHNGTFGPSSPTRSTTGSQELEDTYGVYGLRSTPEPPGVYGSRHTVGSVAPSSFWLEHRAAAHHTAAGSVRGHVSMDETRLQGSRLNTPIAFSAAGSRPANMVSEDAECLFTARRDNYVARTFSHMARARLDHAVSRSADLDHLGSEKWEMRFADDGPCTLSQSGASEEGAISKAKRMMSEAATAQASTFMRGEGTDQRDVDGTCCLLDALAAPKVSIKKQLDVLSTLAFLTSGSEINAGSVVASRGMATLVPLLGKKSEKIAIGAAKVIANLLISPAGEDAFVEENGLLVLSSLLSTSKAPALLQSVLCCLGAFVHQACVPDVHGAQSDVGRAAGNVMLLERSRAIPAAIRLSSAHESPDFSEAEAKGVSLAALNLLLKVSAVPETRTTLRAAGLMSVLASIVTPGDADTAALLEPAIQLVAALASDLAAAVEFTAGGGILGLLAILSDSPTKGALSMHAATVLGVLVNCRRVRGAIWAAGGGSVLLPTVATASPQSLRGLLYLLSCLAKYDDMRAEMEAAGAVDVLLELLGSCHDTKVQAATLSLLRILTRAGKTLCAIPEHQTSLFSQSSFVPMRASLGNMSANKRRSLDGPSHREALPAAQSLAASGRSQSLCL